MYGSTCADMQVDVMGECLSSIKHVVGTTSGCFYLRSNHWEKLEEGRSVTSVAAEFGIAHSIVSRLWRQFQTTGTAIQGFSSGRPRGTTPANDRQKNSETLALSSSGIQKILELIFFATAIEKNVQQTVAAAITIVTTCNFTFRSHPPLSRKPRLSIYTGDVLVTSSTVMLRTLKNGTAALGNHSFTGQKKQAADSGRNR
ncbi:uncharacterized protein TNCV_4757331 [Trichonephila clavipes]|nr:uncharacterized protein TNCV_4757331 [Trichonephila clavipes]